MQKSLEWPLYAPIDQGEEANNSQNTHEFIWPDVVVSEKFGEKTHLAPL